MSKHSEGSKVRKPVKKAHQNKFLKGLISGKGTSRDFNPVGGRDLPKLK